MKFTPLTGYRAAANPALTIEEARSLLIQAAHELALRMDALIQMSKETPHEMVTPDPGIAASAPSPVTSEPAVGNAPAAAPDVGAVDQPQERVG